MNDEHDGAARLTDGQAELALGVRRRRWVLGVLAFMMLMALIAAGVIGMRMAPSVDRESRERADESRTVASMTSTLHDARRAQFVALIDGSASGLRNAADVHAQLVPIANGLTDTLPSEARSDLQAVLDAADELDAAVQQAADHLSAGDADRAAAVMVGDGDSAAMTLDDSLERVRAVVDAGAVRTSADAADILRLMALALIVPVIPTAWVFAQLIVGVRQIRRIANQMHDLGSEVSSSAAQLSAASEELAASSVEGAAAFSEALATIEELARAADSIAESVDGVAVQSHDMRSNIEAAGSDMEESSARLLALANRVNEIGDILGLINEIADQTNLLALNAAIEAARAGESGKGFTVVAEEVRRLAERSKSSSAQIAEIIDSAQSETSATVLAMEKGAKQMQHAMAFMDTVAGASAEGRMSAEQQRSATQQVVITFEQLSGNTKAVSATTHQIAASAVGLANLAKKLEDTAANSAAGV